VPRTNRSSHCSHGPHVTHTPLLRDGNALPSANSLGHLKLWHQTSENHCTNQVEMADQDTTQHAWHAQLQSTRSGGKLSLPEADTWAYHFITSDRVLEFVPPHKFEIFRVNFTSQLGCMDTLPHPDVLKTTRLGDDSKSPWGSGGIGYGFVPCHGRSEYFSLRRPGRFLALASFQPECFGHFYRKEWRHNLRRELVQPLLQKVTTILLVIRDGVHTSSLSRT
jgi:hypothetical protein